MSLCLATSAVALQIAAQAFTLSWVHSVERTEWREQWRVEGTQLQLEQARVRGSGAGMDPGDDAVLQDGWWVWPGHGLTVPELNLANSGATVSGWTFCTTAGGCHDLAGWLTRGGQPPGAVRIADGGQVCERLTARPQPLGDAESMPTTPSPAPVTRR